MNRKPLAMGLVFGAMVMFIASLNMLDGDRLAQSAAAVIYAVAVVVIMRWANRATA